MAPPKNDSLESFDFPSGKLIANKYVIETLLGKGWESEVYLTKERSTGIERAAKFFFPHRNLGNKVAQRYARKLYRVRHIPSVIQYHNHEVIRVRGHDITCLISDFVEGELLDDFLARQPGKRMHPFMALNVLAEVCAAVELIHLDGEYHGDLHGGNILIRQFGTGFNVKLIDPFDWRDSSRQNMKKDVVDMIRVFYELLGGTKFYARQCSEIKQICCGMRAPTINQRYKTASDLAHHLGSIHWKS